MRAARAVGTLALACASARAAPPPHIVFILADDWGSADASYRMRDLGRTPQFETPAIDRLAAEGRVLADYYVQPICSPTRSTLLSGRYQIHTGLQHDIIQNGQDNAVDPSGSMVLLPEALRALGYGTHMVGKWHVGYAREEYCPWRRGFDTFLGFLSGSEDHYTHCSGRFLDFYNGSTPDGRPYPDAAPRGCPGWPRRARGSDVCPDARAGEEAADAACAPPRAPPKPAACEGNYSAHLFTAEAARLIRRHAARAAEAAGAAHEVEAAGAGATPPPPMPPFFLYLAHQAVHWPMQAPPSLLARAAHIADPWRRQYAAMALALDDSVAAVHAALEAAGMWERTLLVLSSDNGGMSHGYNGAGSSCGGLNWPYRGWKDSLWEGGVRAIGIARLPPQLLAGSAQADGAEPPRARAPSDALRGLFHVSDWLPTLVSAAGGDGARLGPLDGLNQLRFLQRGRHSARKEVLLNIDPLSRRAALRVGTWKVVLESGGRLKRGWCELNATSGGIDVPCPQAPAPLAAPAAPAAAAELARELGWGGWGVPQLFELGADPRELTDVAERRRSKLKRLLARLTELNATAVPCRYPPKDPAWDPSKTGDTLAPFLPDRPARLPASTAGLLGLVRLVDSA